MSNGGWNPSGKRSTNARVRYEHVEIDISRSELPA
jgi:hypothetical protein